MSQLLRFLIGLICLTMFSVNAFSQSRWKLAAVNSNGTPYYVDETLSQQPNGNILGWEKSDVPPNEVYPSGSYFVARYEWDCSNKRQRQLQVFIYDRLGDFIERLDVDTSWKENPPDSVGEIILKDVCSVLKKKNNNVNSSKSTEDVDSFAQIIVRKANLMSEAHSDSEVIRKVSLGEKLILVSKESIGVWYQVIDSKTNKRGWLNGNNFKIVKVEKSTKSVRKKTRKRK
jgi:hypothetical protein